MNIEEAVEHCHRGISIWNWASNCQEDPDIVIASCGDVTTAEALAATAILRREFPELKIRFINIVDLAKLISADEHPHGLTNEEFDKLFTIDKDVIVNFHGYPWLIHKLTNERTCQQRLHVHGYREKGNINTPLELAIINKIDRFSLVIDVIQRVKNIGPRGTIVKEEMLKEIDDNVHYAHENGIDREEITNWKWQYR